ncbi:hypothetical protein BaRGS_00010207, partial [Batillaria attramentaria]
QDLGTYESSRRKWDKTPLFLGPAAQNKVDHNDSRGRQKEAATVLYCTQQA